MDMPNLTRLPNIAYDAGVTPNFSEVLYFPRQNSKPGKLCRTKLPLWLRNLIQESIDVAKQEGAEEVRRQIREALHVLPSR